MVQYVLKGLISSHHHLSSFPSLATLSLVSLPLPISSISSFFFYFICLPCFPQWPFFCPSAVSPPQATVVVGMAGVGKFRFVYTPMIYYWNSYDCFLSCNKRRHLLIRVYRRWIVSTHVSRGAAAACGGGGSGGVVMLVAAIVVFVYINKWKTQNAAQIDSMHLGFIRFSLIHFPAALTHGTSWFAPNVYTTPS